MKPQDHGTALHKARQVCDGSRGIKGVDYHESYLGTAPMSDIRRLDVLAMQCGWFTFEDDWSMAYTQTVHGARPDGEHAYVSPAVGVRVFDELTGRPKNRKLMQYLYGEKEAGFGHTRAATDSIINRNVPGGQPRCPFDMQQCPHQPTIFSATFHAGHQHHGEKFICYLHNDNLRAWTPSIEAYTEFRAWLQHRWDITGPGRPLQPAAGACGARGSPPAWSAFSR